MAFKSQNSQDPVQKYIDYHTLRLTEQQKKLIEKTQTLENACMLGATDQLQFFQLLLKATNAKKVIEIGTFTGYSALTMALALPDDGEVVSCDITDELVQYDMWKEAGVEKKIKVRLGQAVDTLNELIGNDMDNKFDFAFIDGDKGNYLNYYELCLKLVRRGGIIAFDNVLWDREVADPSINNDFVVIMRNVAKFVKEDQRVDISMINLGDGVLFCLKR